MFPEHGRDVETLMQRADIAMYSAKARGVGYEVYSAVARRRIPAPASP